jgi:hypothetical protein
LDIIWDKSGDKIILEKGGGLLDWNTFAANYRRCIKEALAILNKLLLRNTTEGSRLAPYLPHDNMLLNGQTCNANCCDLKLLHDDLANNTPGYSFLNEELNAKFGFGGHIEYLQLLVREKYLSLQGQIFLPNQAPTSITGKSGVIFNKPHILKWGALVEELQRWMIIITLVGGSMHPRAGEFVSLQFTNSTISKRNCFLKSEKFLMIPFHNKNRTKKGIDSAIVRGLESIATVLWIAIFDLIRPLQILFAPALYPSTSADELLDLRTMLFVNNRGIRFERTSMSNLLSTTLLPKYLNLKVNNRYLRHLLQAWQEKFLLDDKQLQIIQDNMRTVANSQMGHSNYVGKTHYW